MSEELADLCEAIVDCEHKTVPEGDGFAWSVGTRAMKDGRLLIEACKPVSRSTYEAWARRMKPQAGDLVLAREAPVGQVIRVPEGTRLCLGQRTVLIRPAVERVHPRFLHYWLLGPDAQGVMTARAGGATVPHLNVQDIRSLDVSSLPEDGRVQEVAAETLGALDDLIENNRRRIELLEQMAQAIYREWFVRFRYPGHEGATFVDSPLGPIPEGWEVRPLVSLARLTMGQSPRSEYYNTGGVGKPFHQGVMGFGRHFPTHRKYCSVDGRTAVKGDVLISVRAPVGRLNLAPDDITIGRGLAAARSLIGRQALLYRALRDVVFAEEDSMGGGTIFKAIGKNELEEVRLLVAPDAIEEAAEAVLVEHAALIKTLTFKNRALASLRDLLLPKLVTGEIDVSNLDLYVVVESSR